MIFSKHTKGQRSAIVMAFKHHMPESGCLLIYNQGKAKFQKIIITLTNTEGKEFTFTKDEISTRSNESIDLQKYTDINGSLFSGKLTKIYLTTGGHSWLFKVLENGKINEL